MRPFLHCWLRRRHVGGYQGCDGVTLMGLSLSLWLRGCFGARRPCLLGCSRYEGLCVCQDDVMFARWDPDSGVEGLRCASNVEGAPKYSARACAAGPDRKDLIGRPSPSNISTMPA